MQILAKNEDKESWKMITGEILLEIYGNTSGNYSATGRRGERHAINPQLHKGLFGMIFYSAFSRCITYLHYYRVFLNIHVTEWFNRDMHPFRNSQKSVPHFQSGIHIVRYALLSNKKLTNKRNKQFPTGSNMEICHEYNASNMTPQEYR